MEAIKKAQESVAESLNLPTSTVKNMNESLIKNTTSKSFGIVIARNKNQDDLVIYNLIKKNSSLPCKVNRTFNTIMPNQQDVELRIMEDLLLDEIIELNAGKEIGNAVLPLPTGLPDDSPIEVTFNLDDSGLLKYHGKDISSGNIIDGEIQTTALMSDTELQEAKKRSKEITIS